MTGYPECFSLCHHHCLFPQIFWPLPKCHLFISIRVIGPFEWKLKYIRLFSPLLYLKHQGDSKNQWMLPVFVEGVASETQCCLGCKGMGRAQVLLAFLIISCMLWFHVFSTCILFLFYPLLMSLTIPFPMILYFYSLCDTLFLFLSSSLLSHCHFM